MSSEIWAKRSQWATAFFQDECTIGYSTTQRSEGWHSVMKSFVNSFSLRNMVNDIKLLCERQKTKERISTNDPTERLKHVGSSEIVKQLKLNDL